MGKVQLTCSKLDINTKENRDLKILSTASVGTLKNNENTAYGATPVTHTPVTVSLEMPLGYSNIADFFAEKKEVESFECLRELNHQNDLKDVNHKFSKVHIVSYSRSGSLKNNNFTKSIETFKFVAKTCEVDGMTYANGWQSQG